MVTQHSGEGKANQYFLRGFNLDHGTDLAIRLDGMPLNMRSHAHGQGYADLNFLIPELLDGIHVRKGPYFADEGISPPPAHCGST
ncbi:TonB-dependent receptor plug domain-containing protein [Siccirubricoccus deserti]